MAPSVFAALARRKHINEDTLEESSLARVLTVLDLTALGIGSTLGAGVYVLTGAVAKETAGPSVVVSFFIAALTSILSGLCYAEFGARVPKAGSGYVYSYVTVGELCAFVIGWNLILSYVIGTASVARAWTANFDALINKNIELYMLNCCKMDLPGLAPYPDLFSFAIVLLLTALIAFGAREFATVNKVFTVLNIGVIVFVIIAGLSKADIYNWAWTPEKIKEYLNNMSNVTQSYEIKNADASTSPFALNGMYTQTSSSAIADGPTASQTPLNHLSHRVNLSVTDVTPVTTHASYGVGGFLPFGVAGLISGTATCFYAFAGFDCIATTGEEAINPQRSIPLGIVFSLVVCCISYLGISSTLTLMQPYFLLNKDAPLPFAFDYVGIGWARYPVSVGAICALSTSLMGTMFPMPRIIYAMALDGLLFKFLAEIHERTKTPIIATFLSGTLAGIMAVFFDLKELVDLTSFGTLAAFSLVAVSVLLLRYQPDPEVGNIASVKEINDEEVVKIIDGYETHFGKLMTLFKPKSSLPTPRSSRVVNYLTAAIVFLITVFSVLTVIASKTFWSPVNITFCIITGLLTIGATTCIYCQPHSSKKLSIEVPAVPFIPIVCLFVNIFLMISLPISTWYKMLIWMLLGFLIYFSYGIWHSDEAQPRSNSTELKQTQLPIVEQSEQYNPETKLSEIV